MNGRQCAVECWMMKIKKMTEMKLLSISNQMMLLLKRKLNRINQNLFYPHIISSKTNRLLVLFLNAGVAAMVRIKKLYKMYRF